MTDAASIKLADGPDQAQTLQQSQQSDSFLAPLRTVSRTGESARDITTDFREAASGSILQTPIVGKEPDTFKRWRQVN